MEFELIKLQLELEKVKFQRSMSDLLNGFIEELDKIDEENLQLLMTIMFDYLESIKTVTRDGK
jgi:hypothetical protein